MAVLVNLRSQPAAYRLRKLTMLYTIAFVLFALWLFGMVTSYTMVGLIHVVLAVAVAVVLLRAIGGRSSV
jgi:hypothetical protein